MDRRQLETLAKFRIAYIILDYKNEQRKGSSAEQIAQEIIDVLEVEFNYRMVQEP